MPQYTREFSVTAQNLHLPVKNCAPYFIGRIWKDGRMLREFTIELSPDQTPDWWAFYDISSFHGQTITLTLEGDFVDEAQLSNLDRMIQQGDSLLGVQDLYSEKYRPQFHFTSRRGWNNDPNGLIYYQDTWHLFYQHNPFGTLWGNMHWGHAVSQDLVHWEEQPVALFQKSLQDMAWSGGAVIDINNTARFGKDEGIQPMVLAFTSTGRGECLAYSLDGGKTFIEYQGNPVLRHVGRDPKIIWYEPGKKWVMIVYEEIGEERGYAIYDSHNLIAWNRLQFLPGYFECPELFELPVDGDAQIKKWVIYGSLWEKYPSVYVIGSFDGCQFSPETEPIPAHFGPSSYAAQTFSHAPDNRCIMIGWMRGAAFPKMPFSQGLTVPLELSLHNTPSGLRLCFNPVQELSGLSKLALGLQSITLAQANEALEVIDGELLDVKLHIIPEGHARLALEVRGHTISFDPVASSVEFAGKIAPVNLHEGKLDLRLLVDRAVTEVFAGNGDAAFAAMTLFPEGRQSIRISGSAKVERLTVHSLKSIWFE